MNRQELMVILVYILQSVAPEVDEKTLVADQSPAIRSISIQ